MVSCPCGCGRRVGRGKRGFAKGLVSVLEMRDHLAPAIDACLADAGVAEDRRVELINTRVAGEQLSGWLLEHVHGVARPDRTPNGLELVRLKDVWFRAAMAAVALTTIREEAPRSYDEVETQGRMGLAVAFPVDGSVDVFFGRSTAISVQPPIPAHVLAWIVADDGAWAALRRSRWVSRLITSGDAGLLERAAAVLTHLPGPDEPALDRRVLAQAAATNPHDLDAGCPTGGLVLAILTASGAVGGGSRHADGLGQRRCQLRRHHRWPHPPRHRPRALAHPRWCARDRPASCARGLHLAAWSRRDRLRDREPFGPRRRHVCQERSSGVHLRHPVTGRTRRARSPAWPCVPTSTMRA